MQGLRKDLIAMLDTIGVPGAIISIQSKTYKNLEILYGYSQLETQKPMSLDLAFRIGSVTKTFTGTMLLQLYDEQQFDLDSPIETILLGVPNGENITIRQVGSMRSGIANFSVGSRFQDALDRDPTRIWLSSEMLLLGVSKPPDFPPGTDFNYSNTNSIILACSIERLNDKTYGKSLNDRMFQPLGLHNTHYTAYIQDPCINGYVFENGKYINATNYNDSWAWSAGEIVSTVGDMHKYLKRSIANYQTLTLDAVKQQRYWQKIELVDNVVRKYGFQLLKLNNYIGHNGSLPGYNIYILYSLKTQTSVVIVCNIQFSTNNNQPPATEIANLIVSRLK